MKMLEVFRVSALFLTACSTPRTVGDEGWSNATPADARSTNDRSASGTVSATRAAGASSETASSEAARGPEESPPPGFVPIPERRSGAFPGIEFNEVRAFAFDLEVPERPVCAMPLDRDGTLCSTVSRPGVKLTPDQSQELLGMLSKKSTFGSGSACFLPHHGFVFYDGEMPVAELSVCFLCDMGRSLPALPVAGGSEFGLSEEATARFRKLCRELGLPKCDAQKPEEFAPR